jgi:hypothetical protein
LNVGARAVGAHVEDDVLERGSLSNLPMDTSTSSDRHVRNVNNEVTDLTEEVVLVCVPVTASIVSDLIRSALGDQDSRSTTLIRVRVDNRNTLESGGSLDSWESNGISDELSVVELNDRGRDGVSSRWDLEQVSDEFLRR